MTENKGPRHTDPPPARLEEASKGVRLITTQMAQDIEPPSLSLEPPTSDASQSAPPNPPVPEGNAGDQN
jgi:hypothetical protein